MQQKNIIQVKYFSEKIYSNITKKYSKCYLVMKHVCFFSVSVCALNVHLSNTANNFNNIIPDS
jgi:hypothetical protein